MAKKAAKEKEQGDSPALETGSVEIVSPAVPPLERPADSLDKPAGEKPAGEKPKKEKPVKRVVSVVGPDDDKHLYRVCCDGFPDVEVVAVDEGEALRTLRLTRNTGTKAVQVTRIE